MASPTILIKKTFTQADIDKSMEADGRRRGTTAGSYIADLAALKKVILLCSLCTHKFNPGRVGYRREKEFPVAQGKCDGCNTYDLRCSWYVYDELYSMVRSTVDERRALARSREKRIKQGYLG